MRHRKTVSKLGRDSEARKALMRSLMTSLVLHESITTTQAKAKALRPAIEKVITKGRSNTLHTKRELTKIFYKESAVNKVLEVLSPKYKDRNGGYTRIINLGHRQGDGSKMVQIEFV